MTLIAYRDSTLSRVPKREPTRIILRRRARFALLAACLTGQIKVQDRRTGVPMALPGAGEAWAVYGWRGI